MASYVFLTTWHLDAPIESVYDVLKESADYPRWWQGVASVELLAEGDEDGLGQIDRYAWRSVLPYTLRFDARVTRVEPLRLIEARVTGELEGVGTWRLFAGEGTAVVFDWRVRTTRTWMNALGPIARPVFVWNHDRVMAGGGVGLARELGVRLLAAS
ncbi:MAG TPA: SRPBCC family protein [Solirubrobacteraceae bacterium]|nr:SRPBCC family protein [Solirubrobacteraceae bacterium]